MGIKGVVLLRHEDAPAAIDRASTVADHGVSRSLPMPPDDPTPLGDAMTHRFTQQKIPDPKPNDEDARPANAQADIDRRPALPEHPERMAADIEDEEADPVVDTGPGIADGLKSLKKQRG
jgi:hypothetical protein